tara:strand:+ start:456 stop:689 length:234 start_codon:yes stop_codon:yes gene_type:complete
MTTNELNIIGLSLDIIGVILLFFYEPPKPETGAILLASAPSKKERDITNRLKDKLSSLALSLIIIGFMIQILSNALA